MKVMIDVPLQRISDLLCCALEGGSNYWYHIEKFIRPAQLAFLSDADQAKAMKREPQTFKHLDYPLNAGGALVISDRDRPEMGDKCRTERLDLSTVERGMTIFLSKYPRHFADFMAENEDACTGDVFLQCCLFGEAVYG